MVKKIIGFSVVAALALTLGGCGGSDSSSGVTSGVVVGSYYRNAKVCLDANNNGRCDTGEILTRSDNNGAYSLAGSGSPVVAEIATDAVKYEPSTGVATPVTAPLVFRAPADAPNVVSSITTMIVAKMDAGQSLAAAKSAVASEMGLPAEKLMTDFNQEADATVKSTIQAKATQAMNTIQTAVASGADIKTALQQALNDFITYYAVPATTTTTTSSSSPVFTPFSVNSSMINNTQFEFLDTLDSAVTYSQGGRGGCSWMFMSNGTVDINNCDGETLGNSTWSIVDNSKVFVSKNATHNSTLEFLTSSGQTLPTGLQQVKFYWGGNLSATPNVAYVGALHWNYGRAFDNQFTGNHSFNVTNYATTGVTNYKFINETHVNATWYTNQNGTLATWDWTTDTEQLTLNFTGANGVSNGTTFQNLSFEQNPMQTTGYIANAWGWLVTNFNSAVTTITKAFATFIS